MPVWGIVKTTTPRWRGHLDVLLPEAEMYYLFYYTEITIRQETLREGAGEEDAAF